MFCAIRKKWLVALPEELVRQTAVLYLESRGYSLNHMSVERQIELAGMSRRYDLVLSDKNGDPVILVECKAANVSLAQHVVDQAGMYNLVLGSGIIWVTNGHQNRIFTIDHREKSYREIDSIPLHESQ